MNSDNDDKSLGWYKIAIFTTIFFSIVKIMKIIHEQGHW